jgi:hypothetical protein
MYKQSQRTAWEVGIKPKMDGKHTWYMFKDDLSKTTEILIKKKQRFLLPTLIKEKCNYFSYSKDPYFRSHSHIHSGLLDSWVSDHQDSSLFLGDQIPIVYLTPSE